MVLTTQLHLRRIAKACALAMPAVAIATLLFSAGASAAVVHEAVRRGDSADNQGVVGLVTGSSSDVSVRIAEDIASVVDDGATRRVLPVIGKGSQHNLIDLMALRGIDMAILQTDVLESARANRLVPGLEGAISYITQLQNLEFHLLARSDIASVRDLAQQKVNFDLRGSGTAVTAGALFSLLKIPVQSTNDSQDTALAKLRSGEIAAIAFVAAKPAELFQRLKSSEGFHFLAIPLEETIAAYPPTNLSAADYPELVPQNQTVDTLAVGTVLAVVNFPPGSARYSNMANFVDAFFTGFQALLEPGHLAAWKDINIAAELPGWRRFLPADQWLKRNAAVAIKPTPEDLKSTFSRFIDKRQELVGGASMTQQQKDELFNRFERWQSAQPH